MGAVCAGATPSCAIPPCRHEGVKAASWPADVRRKSQAHIDYLVFPTTTHIAKSGGNDVTGNAESAGGGGSRGNGTLAECLRSPCALLMLTACVESAHRSTGSADVTLAAPHVPVLRLGVTSFRDPEAPPHSSERPRVRGDPDPLSSSDCFTALDNPAQSFDTEDLEPVPARRRPHCSGPSSPLQGGGLIGPPESFGSEDLESVQAGRRPNSSRKSSGSPTFGRTLSARIFGARRRSPQSPADSGEFDPSPAPCRGSRVSASPAPKADIRPPKAALPNPARWGLQVLKFKVSKKGASVKDAPPTDRQRCIRTPPRAQVFNGSDSFDSQRTE